MFCHLPYLDMQEFLLLVSVVLWYGCSIYSIILLLVLPLLVVFPLAVSLPLAELGTAGVIGRCTLLTKKQVPYRFISVVDLSIVLNKTSGPHSDLYCYSKKLIR